MGEINAFPLSQSKSNPDPKFWRHFAVQIQSKINKLHYCLDPVQCSSLQRTTPGPSLCVISHPLNPNWCQNAAMANVDRLRLLGLSCIKNAGYFPRYSAINSIFKKVINLH